MASRSLGSLTIDLIAKVAGFEQGMDRAARTSDRRLGQIERRAKVAAAAIGAAVAAVPALTARAIRSQITAMDEMSKAALRANIPTEQFSQLAHAANLSDVSIQDLTTSMGRLARAQSDAQRGLVTQSEAFEKLGIAFQNADGTLRDGRDVLLDFADAYQKFGGTQEFLAAGMQVFGRSFQNLIPLLSQGSAGLAAAADEADRLGITLSTQAGQQAEKFNDDLTRLKTAVDGVWRSVASDLLPSLIDLTEQMVNTSTAGDQVSTTAEKISETIRAVGAAAYYTITPLLRLREVMQGVIGQAGGFGTTLRGILTFDAEQIKEGVAEYRAATAEIDHAFRDMALRQNQFRGVTGGVESTAQRAGNPFAGIDEEATKAQSSRAAATRDVNAALREQLQEQQRLADAQRGWHDQLLDAQAALEGPIAEANRQYEKQITELNRAFDEGEVSLSVLVQTQEVYREQLDRTIEAIEAQRTPLERLLEDLEFEKELLTLSNEEREIAIALRWAGAEATDAEREAVAKSVRELREARQATSDLIDAQDSVRAAGADFLTDWTTGAKSFKDAMTDALTSIHRQLTRMISERLIEQLFGQRGQSGGGTWGDALASIFGGMFSGGGGKANGGWAMPNSIYEVNERGVEMATVGGRDYMLTGNQPVHVTPHERLKGGRNVAVTQNFYNPTMVDRNSAAQREQEAAYKLRVSTARA